MTNQSDSEPLVGQSEPLAIHTSAATSAAAAQYLEALKDYPTDLFNLSEKEKATWVHEKYTEFKKRYLANPARTSLALETAALRLRRNLCGLIIQETQLNDCATLGPGNRNANVQVRNSHSVAMLTCFNSRSAIA